jgi:O-antigen/teichoic acid export membrane protein
LSVGLQRSQVSDVDLICRDDSGPPDDVARKPSPGLRTLGRNSIWGSAGAICAVALRVAESLIIARVLGPSGLGLYVLILAFPEAIQQLADSRTREAVPKFLGDALEHGDGPRAIAVMKLLWAVDVALSLAAFLIVAGTSALAARVIMHDATAAPLVVLYASGKLIASLRAVAGSVLRTMDRFRAAFFASLAGELARLLFLVFALLGGYGLTGAVFAIVLSEVASTAVLGGTALAAFLPSHWSERRTRVSTLGSKRRDILSFLLFTNLSATAAMASSKVDVLLIGALTSTTTVGTYKLAVQLGMAVLLISDPIQVALYPQVARALSSGRAREVRHLIGRLTRLLTAVVLPVSIAAIFAAGPLVELTLGPSYARATVPAVVLLWLVAPSAVLCWGRPLMLSTGQARRLFRYYLTGVGVQFVLLSTLVRPLGSLGGVLALGVGYLVIAALQMGFVVRSGVLRGDMIRARGGSG